MFSAFKLLLDNAYGDVEVFGDFVEEVAFFEVFLEGVGGYVPVEYFLGAAVVVDFDDFDEFAS